VIGGGYERNGSGKDAAAEMDGTCIGLSDDKYGHTAIFSARFYEDMGVWISICKLRVTGTSVFAGDCGGRRK